MITETYIFHNPNSYSWSKIIYW